MSNLDNLNYFTIFSLDQSAKQDIEKIEFMYNKLLLDFHPDKFTDQNKKNTASAITDKIHIAYQTLICPLKIRFYLLELKKNDLNLDSYKLENEFLEHVFQISEKIDNDNFAELNNIIAKLESEYNEYLNLFDLKLEKNLEEAARSILKAKYLAKLISSCNIILQREH